MKCTEYIYGVHTTLCMDGGCVVRLRGIYRRVLCPPYSVQMRSLHRRILQAKHHNFPILHRVLRWDNELLLKNSNLFPPRIETSKHMSYYDFISTWHRHYSVLPASHQGYFVEKLIMIIPMLFCGDHFGASARHGFGRMPKGGSLVGN